MTKPTPMKPMSQTLTTKQVCELLGVHRVTLANYVKQGFILADKTPTGRYRYCNHSIESFINYGKPIDPLAPNSVDDIYVNTSRATELLNVHRLTLMTYVDDGVIVGYKAHNGQWRFALSDIIELTRTDETELTGYTLDGEAVVRVLGIKPRTMQKHLTTSGIDSQRGVDGVVLYCDADVYEYAKITNPENFPDENPYTRTIGLKKVVKILQCSTDMLSEYVMFGLIRATILENGLWRYLEADVLKRAETQSIFQNYTLTAMDAVKALDVLPSTLRSYEKRGVISSQETTDGRKLYNDLQVFAKARYNGVTPNIVSTIRRKQPEMPLSSFSSAKAFRYFTEQQATLVDDFITEFPSQSGKPVSAQYFYKLTSHDVRNIKVLDCCAMFFKIDIRDFLDAGWVDGFVN